MKRNYIQPKFLTKTIHLFYQCQDSQESLVLMETGLKAFLIDDMNKIQSDLRLFHKYIASEKTIDVFLSSDTLIENEPPPVFCNDNIIRPIIESLDLILLRGFEESIFVNFIRKDKNMLKFIISVLTDEINNAFHDFSFIFLKLLSKIQALFPNDDSLELLFEAMCLDMTVVYVFAQTLKKTLIKFFFYRSNENQDENELNATHFFIKTFFKRIPHFLRMFYAFLLFDPLNLKKENQFQIFIAMLLEKMNKLLPKIFFLIDFEHFSCIDIKKIIVLVDNMAGYIRSFKPQDFESIIDFFESHCWTKEEFLTFYKKKHEQNHFERMFFVHISVDRSGLIYFLKTVGSFELKDENILKNRLEAIQNLNELKQDKIYIFIKKNSKECEKCRRFEHLFNNLSNLLSSIRENKDKSILSIFQTRKLSFEQSLETTLSLCFIEKNGENNILENHISEEFRYHFFAKLSFHMREMKIIDILMSRIKLAKHIFSDCVCLRRTINQVVVFKLISTVIQGDKFNFTLKYKNQQKIDQKKGVTELILAMDIQEHILKKSSIYDENYRIRKNDFKLLTIRRLKDLFIFMCKEQIFWKITVDHETRTIIKKLLFEIIEITKKYLLLANIKLRYGIDFAEVELHLRCFIFDELLLYLAKSRKMYFIDQISWPSVFLIQQILPIQEKAFKKILEIKSCSELSRELANFLMIGKLKYVMKILEMEVFFHVFIKKINDFAKDILGETHPSTKVC